MKREQKKLITTVVSAKDIQLLQTLRNMHPKDFEDFIKVMYELQGYKTVFTAPRTKVKGCWKPKSDQGIDLIEQKEHLEYIQVKKLQSRVVTFQEITSFYGIITDKLRGNNIGVFITTSLFSVQASEFAKQCRKNCLHLVDYLALIRSMKELSFDSKKNLNQFLTSKELIENSLFEKYTNTCPLCGAPLKKDKNSKYNQMICLNKDIGGCKYFQAL